MPPRKRKVTYPVARTSKHPAPADAGPNPNYVRTSTAIDTTAGAGRTGLAIGARVRIIGTGLYSGEAATIIPFDSSPRNFRGARFTTITTLRPTSVSGE